MNCNHESVEIDDGERVCTCCGTIMGSVINEGPEWRVYANTEDDPSRTGTLVNELLPNSSYGSMMQRKRYPKQSDELKAISKLSAWSFSSHGERSWMGIFDAIQASCTRIGLPKAIIVDACGFFKNIEDSQKTRGETRRALMAAAVFVACRQHSATRTHEEVANLFHVSIRALCKAVMRYEPETSNVLNTQLGIAERMCVDLALSDAQRDQVIGLLNKLPELEHTPKTVVAGVIAFIVGGSVQKVCEVSKVSAVSIRKIVDKLRRGEIGN